MKIGFHYQGQYCTAVMKASQVQQIFVDGMELNILPEMLPEIMKAYREMQAKNN